MRKKLLYDNVYEIVRSLKIKGGFIDIIKDILQEMITTFQTINYENYTIILPQLDF